MTDKVRFFFMGVICALLFVMLIAAIDTSAPNYGRFQISAWAGRFTDLSGGFGVFVVDTTSGETRLIYSRVYGKGKGRVVIDNLGRPFAASSR